MGFIYKVFPFFISLAVKAYAEAYIILVMLIFHIMHKYCGNKMKPQAFANNEC